MNRLIALIGAALLVNLAIQLRSVYSIPASDQLTSQPPAVVSARGSREQASSSTDNCPLTIEPAIGYQDVFEEVLAIPYTFKMTNHGTVPVQIDAIKPSCSCTVVNFDVKSIPPGATVEFTAVYDVKTQLGKLSTRRIQIQTDHLGCSQLSCEVGGIRRRRFTITPQTVDFGIVRQGDTPSREVTIQGHGRDMKLMPQQVIGTNVDFDLTFKRDDRNEEGDQIIELELRVPPKAPIGAMAGKLFIPRQEDDGIGPIINISANIFGPVRAVPPSLLFGTIRKREPRTRTLRLQAVNESADDSIRNVRFESLPDGFSAKVSDQRNDVIEVTLNTETYTGPEDFNQGAVVLCDCGETQCRLSVPLTGRIRLDTK